MPATPKPSDTASLALVRAVAQDLVERMSRDMMIGFFFAKTDLVRLAELEYQHAAQTLGLHVTYEGRPLQAVHHPRRIFGGQFDRRLVILGECLERHGAPAELRDAWLAHTRAARDQIVQEGAADCG